MPAQASGSAGVDHEARKAFSLGLEKNQQPVDIQVISNPSELSDLSCKLCGANPHTPSGLGPGSLTPGPSSRNRSSGCPRCASNFSAPFLKRSLFLRDHCAVKPGAQTSNTPVRGSGERIPALVSILDATSNLGYLDIGHLPLLVLSYCSTNLAVLGSCYERHSFL